MIRRITVGSAALAVFFAGLLAVASVVAAETEEALLVTYGPGASADEGDDDHLQVVFLEIPEAFADPVFVRVFDADCGGVHDQVLGTADSQTRFTLIGGDGAWSNAAARAVRPDGAQAVGGVVIEERLFAEDGAVDNGWITLARVEPEAGELVQGARLLRLVVEGLAGDDGNVFQVAISRSAQRNIAPPGARLLSFAPTVRRAGEVAALELRFALPTDLAEVTLGNFDAAGAQVGFDSALRTVELNSSAQGVAQESLVNLEPGEAGGAAAVVLGAGGEDPNDATFWVVDAAGVPLPFELPARLGSRNRRPLLKVSTEALADCFSYVFDGTASSDPDGDLLQFEWQLGDGTTARGRRVVHRYDAPGDYRVSVLVSDSSGRVGNGAWQSLEVVVNQPPVSEAGAELVGEPGQAVDFDGSGSTDADGTVIRFLWDFADGSTGQGATASHAYQQPGKYLASLRVEDDSGLPCNFDVDFVTVWVNFPPVAEAGEDVICSVGEEIRLDGGRSYDTDGTIQEFGWDFGDGKRAVGASVTHVFAEPGTYRVTLDVRDDAGARNSASSDSLTVQVNDPPVAVAGIDRRLAVGEVSLFDASASIDRDGAVVAYTWDFGDGHQGRGRIIPYAYSEPGTYQVSLRIRDNSPADSGVGNDTLKVVVNAPPAAEAGNDRVVTSSEVGFDGSISSDPDGEILNYEWDFGDGATASGAAPKHVYRSPGMYRVTLRVSDDSGTPQNDAVDRVLVLVNERPVADAGPDQVAAPGESVVFEGFGSFDPDGEVLEYRWDFGDGSHGSGRSVAHAFTAAGAYTVRLSVTDDTEDGRAVDFDETVVRVNARPTAMAGADMVAAPGQEVVFDGGLSFDPDGEVASFEWRFSDHQEPANGPITRRSFAAPGSYIARLFVRDSSAASNNSHVDELTVRVNHPPRAIPGPDVFSCDSTVLFDCSRSVDPDGDPLACSWDFGDGSSGTGRQVSHTFAAGGSYPVTLTVDDGSGLANAGHSSAMKVQINRPPVASVGDDLTVCAGQVALFDGSASVDPDGGLLRHRWDMGNGSVHEGVHPTTIYTEGGVYTVSLTVEDDSGLECDSDSDQLVVRVAEAPVADAGPDMTVCANSRVRFDGSGSRDYDGVVNRYVWDFGESARGGGATPEHIFADPGEYRVRLTVTGDQLGDCDNTDSDEVLVRVLQAPVAHIEAAEAVPVGQTVVLDGGGSSGQGATIVGWQWDFGDGTTAAGERVEHVFAAPGRYIVGLEVTTDADVTCGTVATQQTVIVNQAPVAVAGEPRTVGVHQLVELDGSASSDGDGAIVDARWDLGDGTVASGLTARHRYAEPGTYRVTLTVADDAGLDNSRASDALEVRVNAAPIAKIDVADAACAGQEVLFSAVESTDPDGEIVAHHWDFGDGEQADGAAVGHLFKRPGHYHVTLWVDDGLGVANSRQEESLILRVNAAPTPVAGPDQLVCADQEVVLDGGASLDPDGTVVSWMWDLGDGTVREGAQVRHSYAQPATYRVELKVTDDLGGVCGSASSALSVRVNTPPVADAGADRQARVGGAHDAVLFDATGSSDPDGDPLTFEWDFGDGTGGAGAKIFHGFNRPGTYTVKLTVDDGSGLECGVVGDEVVVEVVGW